MKANVQRKRILWALALLSCTIIGSHLYRSHQAESLIDGKPVSKWIEALWYIDSNRDAAKKLCAAGPTVLPYVAAALPEARGLAAELRSTVAEKRILPGSRKMYSPEQVRGDLLDIIKANTYEHRYEPPDDDIRIAVDMLAREATAVPRSAWKYMATLKIMGPSAQRALPVLVQLTITNTNTSAKAFTLDAISEIGVGPYAAEVLNAATNLLFDPDEWTRRAALRAIGVTGAKAASVVPLIVQALQNARSTNENKPWTAVEFQFDALNALARIGTVPTALTNLLAQMMQPSRPARFYPAAAILRINPQHPTALEIVRDCLRLNVDANSQLQILTRFYENAIDPKPFTNEIAQLANSSNRQASNLSRMILKRSAQ